ncbi:MAG: ABC transporter permease subunit [Acidimicrobiia bacterium]|nr:ABC transporter permease subunit [Acidimicrobiia bacterium]MYC85094.1 ABC transporter permease subunit [Acidimicrobiia bacterium]
MIDIATSKWAKWVLIGIFVFEIIFLYAPVTLLYIFSFNEGSVVGFPFVGFSLDWYETAFTNRGLLLSIRTSATIALMSSTASIVVGLLMAIPLARRKFKAKTPIMALVLSPLVVPHLVFGVALLITFRSVDVLTNGFLEFPLSLPAVAIGHVVVLMPLIVLILIPRLQRIDAHLEEAAQDLGASGWRTFRTIILPLIAPALAAAYVISFIISFNEYAVAVFVSGPVTTFPIFVLAELQVPVRVPQIIAISVVVVTLSLLVVVGAEVMRRVFERRYQVLSQTAGLLGVADADTE